ncbi:unnamed protein product [Cuscuta europaea]|uniref:Uncharacterized protein n=1 Tax=Cuscuta europaea TaxID=41803 RepID=A0A9P1E5W3_CUSEU|nr:unnamed protein product [Cuscuta europaea]
MICGMVVDRWSKIAQHLPGRTDNEIKNYWRTRVQKQARQLKIDSNSKKFIEAVKKFWMPRLVEKIEQQQNTSLISPSSNSSSLFSSSSSSSSTQPITTEKPNLLVITSPSSPNQETDTYTPPAVIITQETGKTDSYNEIEDDCYHVEIMENNSCYDADEACFGHYPASMPAFDSRDVSLLGCQMGYDDWFGDEVVDALWGQC